MKNDTPPRPLKQAVRPVELVTLGEAARRFREPERRLRRMATVRKGQTIPFPPPLCIDEGFTWSTGARLWEWSILCGWWELHGNPRPGEVEVEMETCIVRERAVPTRPKVVAITVNQKLSLDDQRRTAAAEAI